MLDADYRPLADPERTPVRPRYPTRVRAWMYAMGSIAAIMDGKMKETRSNGRGRTR